jgi:hypothetical protein
VVIAPDMAARIRISLARLFEVYACSFNSLSLQNIHFSNPHSSNPGPISDVLHISVVPLQPVYSFCARLDRVRTRASAMPKRKKAKDTSQPGEWVLETRRRLQTEEHDCVAERGRDKGLRWQAAAQDVTIAEGASRPDAPAGASTEASYEMMSDSFRLILHRGSLQLAAFHPSQFTTIVMGRPVQVPFFQCMPCKRSCEVDNVLTSVSPLLCSVSSDLFISSCSLSPIVLVCLALSGIGHQLREGASARDDAILQPGHGALPPDLVHGPHSHAASDSAIAGCRLQLVQGPCCVFGMQADTPPTHFPS